MARTAKPDPTLGTALRQFREAAGLSQENVSHAADMTLSGYSKIERNVVSPTWPTVRAIATALGITMQELGEAVDRLG
jgi:transcriptional regulator with XRE-family HTH domain